MSTPNSSNLRDDRVSVRVKISALWAATLLLFAYGDLYGFFAPGRIEEVRRGEVSGIEITQGFLVAVSVYIAIASTMIFLALVLGPGVNRWVNIVLPLLYVVSILASVIGDASAYFVLLSAVESALLLLIVWHAWTWPRQQATATD